MILPDREDIPDPLLSREQWVVWREIYIDERDEYTKVPVNPHTGGKAASDDPETWGSFEDAVQYVEMTLQGDGVGFVFSDDDMLVGVDLDNCFTDDGTLYDRARDIVDELYSFTEISPSGDGLHIYVLASHPGDDYRKGGLETYETERFFTVTGDRFEGTPTEINERNAEFRTIHDEYIARDDGGGNTDTPTGGATKQITLSDAELLEKAKSAENGDYFEDLWEGRWEKHTHRWDGWSAGQGQSEADSALCTMLAFWTNKDKARIKRLFEKSKLHSKKWDDHPSYADRTVDAACKTVSDGYQPTEPDPPAICPDCEDAIGEHNQLENGDWQCPGCHAIWFPDEAET